jgi:hypothetical protein
MSISLEVRSISRLSKWVLFAAVLLLLTVTVPAAAGKSPAVRVKQTSGRIDGLALNGSQVVYGVSTSSLNPKVYSWNVLSGAGSLLQRRRGVGAVLRGTEFAVAGKRIAWIYRGGSPSETDEALIATTLPEKKLRQFASAVRYEDYDTGPTGAWLSGLVGSGNVMAVNSWKTDTAGTVSNARLSLVTPQGLRRIVSGEDSIVAQSVDAGRIVVVRSRNLWPRTQSTRTTALGSVAVYSTAGRLLRTIDAGSATEAALSGNDLAVMTATNRIELYSAKTGSLVRSRRVPAGAAHVDLQAGIAIYSVYPLQGRAGPRKLHVLQLKTGKDVVLATGEAPSPYTQGDDAQIDRLGIVYAVNIKAHGKIAFVPMAHVFAAVSKGHVR